jgi:hypothetical protein
MIFHLHQIALNTLFGRKKIRPSLVEAMDANEIDHSSQKLISESGNSCRVM